MLADRLHELLADTYVLFAKTQNYHWNVEGCNFKSLHEMFEEQYSDLYSAIDVLAEIIRTLGVNTNGTLSEYLRLSKIEEPELGVSSCKMVEDLLRDNMLIQETLNAVLDEAKNQIEAWNFISRIKTADGSITVYCFEEKPTSAIEIKLLCVR